MREEEIEIDPRLANNSFEAKVSEKHLYRSQAEVIMVLSHSFLSFLRIH